MLRTISNTSITSRTGQYAPLDGATRSRFNTLQAQDIKCRPISTESTLSWQLSPDHRKAMNEAIKLIAAAVETANADDKQDLLAIQQQIHSIQEKLVRLEAVLNGAQSFNEREFETQVSITGHVELSNLLQQLDQLQNLHRVRETQADRANREKLANDIKKHLLLGWLIALICTLLFTKSVHAGFPVFSALDAEIGDIQKKLQQPLPIENNNLVSLNKVLTSVREDFRIWSKVAPLEKKNRELNERLENLETTTHLLKASLTESITASLTVSLKEQSDNQLAKELLHNHGQQLAAMRVGIATLEATAGQLEGSIADLRKEDLTIAIKVSKDTGSSTTHEVRPLFGANQAQTQFFLARLKRRMLSAERLTAMERMLKLSGRS